MEESKFYRFIRPLVPKPFRPLVLKYQSMLSYLVFGVLTTLVNFIIYYPLCRIVPYQVSLVIAWLGAVIFAFFVNKLFVFEDDNWQAGHVIRQGVYFGSMRLVSLGMEEAIFFIFVEQLGLNSDITKIIAQFIVVISNYIFSKLLIFRKPKDSP